MASYNKVLLMGNLTRDVEMKNAGGTSVAKFGLAVNESYTTQAGEKRESVLFVDCEAWGKTGENIAKFLGKGKPIFIEGKLKLEQWEDKDGQKRSAIRVTVLGFQFVGGKDDAAQGGEAPNRGERPASNDAPMRRGGGGRHDDPHDF